MKKNELINLLMQIKGNPDVILWNPLVGDFQEVSHAFRSTVVRDSFEDYQSQVLAEVSVERGTICSKHELSEADNKHLRRKYLQDNPWRLIGYAAPKPYKSQFPRKRKSVIVITPKKRGLVLEGRLGTGQY